MLAWHQYVLQCTMRPSVRGLPFMADLILTMSLKGLNMYEIDFINMRLLPILERLSDSNYQVAVWGKKHPKYIDDYYSAYDELVEVTQFFGEAKEFGERSLNKDNLALLIELKNKMRSFEISSEEDEQSELLIKNPKWIEIQKEAGQLLKSVKKEELGL